MPSQVGQKYHVALSEVSTGSVVQTPVGYMLRPRGYTKQDAKVFAPRFGTGEMGLNELDIWKQWAQDDFSGGGFQDKWEDVTRNQSIQNAIVNQIDQRLYGTPTPADLTIAGNSYTTRTVSAIYKDVLYFPANVTSVPQGILSKYNPSTKSTTQVKTDFAGRVSGLAVLKNYLWVAINGSGCWVFDGTTWTNNSGGFGVTLLQAFNGAMYASGSPGSSAEGRLYKHSAAGFDASTSQYVTTVGAVGDENKPIKSFAVFNHRLYIGKKDGLWAYDGVQISQILDYSNDEDTNNFRWMVVHNGALYFVVKNSIYRFNGATVEKVRDFDRYNTIHNMQSFYGRLWVNVWQETGSDGLGGTAGDAIVHCFDGVGWFEYMHLANMSNYMFPYGLYYISDGTYKHLVFEAVGALEGIQTGKVIDLNQEFKQGTNSDITIITSEFDAGFPMIDKYNDQITLSYEGAASGDTLTVYWRIYDGTSWSGWSSTVGGVFRKMQLKIVVHRQTANSNMALTAWNARYILSPSYTREWQLTLLTQGATDQPLRLIDDTEETKTAKALREQVYKLRAVDVPFIFEDIDICKLAVDPGAAGTTITVDTTDGFPNSGYIKVEDELIIYTGKTATTFTGCTRGRWGTSAVSHAVNSIVGTAYRVVMTRIMNEQVIIPSYVDGVMDTSGNESEVTVLLQEA